MNENGGENINHQELANDFVEGDLKGLKKLLEDFNCFKNVNEELFKKVDYDDKSLSNAESNLFSAIKKLDSPSKKIKLLEDLIQILEKKNETSEGFLDKTIDEMSEDELVKAFEYTRDNYEHIDKKIGGWWEDTISELDSKDEIERFQNRIIQKLEKINSGNYMLYIDSTGKNDILNFKEYEDYVKDDEDKYNIDKKSLPNQEVIEKTLEKLLPNQNFSSNQNNVDVLEKLLPNQEDRKNLLLKKKYINKFLNNKDQIHKSITEENQEGVSYMKTPFDKKLTDNTKKIQGWQDEIFIEQHEYIAFLEDKDKITRILQKLSEGKKISLNNINSKLRGDFIDNEKIEVGISEIQEFTKEELNNNFIEKVRKKLKNNYLSKYFEDFLKYSNKDIKNTSENTTNKELYAEVSKKIEDLDGKKLFDYYNKGENDVKKIIIDWILDTENEIGKKEGIFKIFMKNSEFGPTSELLFSPKRTKNMIISMVEDINLKENFSLSFYIQFANKDYRGPELFDKLLAKLDKQDIKNNFNFFINLFNLDNFNYILHYISKLKEKIGDDFQIKDIKNSTLYIKIINFFREGVKYKNKYLSIVDEIKKNLIEWLVDKTQLIDSYDTYINKKGRKPKKSELIKKLEEQNLNLLDGTKLNPDIFFKYYEAGFSADDIYKKINQELGNIKGSKKQEIFSEISIEIKKLAEKKQDENQTNLNKCIKNIKEKYPDSYKKIKHLLKENENGDIDIKELEKEFQEFKKNSKEKGPIDNKTLFKDYLKTKYGVTEENGELFELFELLEEKQQIQEFTQENKIITNNIEEYIQYLDSGSNKSFEDYAKENGITLKTNNSNLETSPKDTLKNTYIFNNTIYNYNPETGIINSNGKNIELSEQDKQVVKNNPEAMENLVKFSDVLQKVGLTKLWNIKEQIFKAIGNVEGQGFKLDGDYLNESEIMKFLNSILVSVGEKEQTEVTGLDDMIAKMQVLNKIQAFGGLKTENNLYGTTTIEEKFINNFIPRGNIIGFLVGNFTNAISGKSVYKN